MNQIDIKSLGFAVGITAALLYMGCALVMSLTNAETARTFFNGLFHGIDIGSILRMNTTFREIAAGLIQTFVIAWLTGASVAAIYNILIFTRGLRKERYDLGEEHSVINKQSDETQMR